MNLQHNKNLLDTYNHVLNRIMSKEFDWFKRIEIVNIGKSVKYFNPEGFIYVDADWGGKQWKEYHYSKPIDMEELSLGDIVGGKLSLEIQKVFKETFSLITGVEIPRYLSYNWLLVRFVDTPEVDDDYEEETLRESIKRVLKEESRLKKSVKAYIEEYGIKDAAELMGKTLTEVVRIADIPINNKMAYDLIIENFKNHNLPREYKDVTASFNRIVYEFNGILEWQIEFKRENGLTEGLIAFATPFWDGTDVTPVELNYYVLYDDNGKTIEEISGEGDFYEGYKSKNEFENIEELFEWYNEEYLPNVYSIIVNKHLPRARKRLGIT